MLGGLKSLSKEATRPLHPTPGHFLVAEPRGHFRHLVHSDPPYRLLSALPSLALYVSVLQVTKDID